MNYKVGQVLYLCNEENMKIIPIQIIEEITRTNFEFQSSSFPDYKVFGSKSTEKLSPESMEWFGQAKTKVG